MGKPDAMDVVSSGAASFGCLVGVLEGVLLAVLAAAFRGILALSWEDVLEPLSFGDEPVRSDPPGRTPCKSPEGRSEEPAAPI